MAITVYRLFSVIARKLFVGWQKNLEMAEAKIFFKKNRMAIKFLGAAVPSLAVP